MVTTDQVSKSILPWCASEVHRQKAGPLYVPFMFDAWKYAYEQFDGRDPAFLDQHEIRFLNALVLGFDEAMLYRRIAVTFASGGYAAPWQEIPRLMMQLMEFRRTVLADGETLDVDIFVKEFLRIHPFEDGNGRVAAILYNLLNGTLSRPVPLPDYFKE